MIVSIIVPIYNVNKYLSQCIDSLICQTYKDIEIILVDDGSTDNCGGICDSYAKKDTRIKVIHQANAGLSAARNAGLKIAMGDYVFFIDSDDWASKDIIEQLVYTVTSTESDIAICSFSNREDEIVYGIEKKYKIYDSEKAIKEILSEKKFHTSAWGKLFKRELLQNIEFPVGKIYEDFATIYKLFAVSQKIAFVNVKKYYYNFNPLSIVRSAFTKKRMEYFEISDEVLQYMENNFPHLERRVRMRDTRYAISFFKQISEISYEDKEIIDFLVKRIRKNIFAYMFSGYKLKSKLYGFLISIMPTVAYKKFSKI